MVSRFSRVSGLLYYVPIAFGEVSEALIRVLGCKRRGFSVLSGVGTVA